MRRSVDRTKDQTYFLFGLTQEQLARTLFPLGGCEKPQVRELARELGIPTADKPDSQEICFVPNGDYAAFIDAYFRGAGHRAAETRGELVTADGRVVGEHAGVHHFTVGQRRGLGVAAGEPLYVISTEPATQRVIVGRNDDLLRVDHAREGRQLDLDRRAVRARSRRSEDPQQAPRRPPRPITPTADPARVEVRFDEPQRAVTPGQGAVFYAGDLVLGGGWIE